MMKFKFEIKDKTFVTKQEYSEMEYLRLKTGFIWPSYHKYPGIVFLAKDELNNIIGWGFVFKKRGNKSKTFYVYVSKKYRRNGIGGKLYRLADIFNEEQFLNVSKWSDEANNFYESLGK